MKICDVGSKAQFSVCFFPDISKLSELWAPEQQFQNWKAKKVAILRD